MPVQKITFSPGIVRDASQYSNTGGWFDCDKVRFRPVPMSNGSVQSFPETIGGWTQIENTAFRGVCRSLHEWSLLNGEVNLGIGTHLKFYVLNGDIYYDITPQNAPITCPTDPFTTVSNPLQLQANVPFHGCHAGDFIAFSGATTGCGNYTPTQLNQQFQVFSVNDLSTLILIGSISAGAPAQTGGGAAVIATADIQTGPQDSGLAAGWGIGTWGASTYGTARSIPSNTFYKIYLQPRLWSQDNFGQDLIINPRGGQIYVWVANGGLSSRAKLISSFSQASDVPAYANFVYVSPVAQCVVALGCTPFGSGGTPDPMQIRWSDLQNPYMWTPLRTNSAGGQRLQCGSYLIGALSTFTEDLIWTDAALYSMQFNGSQLVFSFRMVADSLSIISPRAATSNGATTYWMDQRCFYAYNGAVSEIPCPLKQWLFSNLNYAQAWKVHAGHNHSFSEIWWFYPSLNATEIDSYVIFNYANGTWSRGTLNRTAWTDPGRVATPIAADPGGVLYFHESGIDANGTALNSYLESCDVDIDGGDQFMFLSRILPDVQFMGATPYQSMFIDILKRDTSAEDKKTDKTFSFNGGTRYLYSRVRGRRLSVKFRSNQIGTGWRLGQTEIDVQPDGGR